MSSLGRRHAHSLASSRHEFRRSGSEGATPSNTTRFLCFQMFQQHRKKNMELCLAGMVLGVAMECSVSTVSGRSTPTCCHSDAATQEEEHLELLVVVLSIGTWKCSVHI